MIKNIFLKEYSHHTTFVQNFNDFRAKPQPLKKLTSWWFFSKIHIVIRFHACHT